MFDSKIAMGVCIGWLLVGVFTGCSSDDSSSGPDGSADKLDGSYLDGLSSGSVNGVSDSADSYTQDQGGSALASGSNKQDGSGDGSKSGQSGGTSNDGLSNGGVSNDGTSNEGSASGTSADDVSNAGNGASDGDDTSNGTPAIAVTESFSDTVNGVVINMVYVKGGTYDRGCDNCAEQDKQYESPVHSVTVDDFHIAKFEVTNELWNAVMGGTANPWEKGKAPKIGISWFDANNFVCKLNSLTGKNYRMLTDAEWEFAARGGNEGVPKKHKFSGSNTLDEVGWFSGNSGAQAHEVGTKAPNELGLYDMSGNAWEWVYDWLVAYTAGAKMNPVQLTGSGNKTRRGGSYDEPEDFARVSRRAIRSRDGAAGMGFRLGFSAKLPEGMVTPCKAGNPESSSCSGGEYRDCRLITGEDSVWTGDGGTMMVLSGGTAGVTGFPAVSGEWYTLNNRSLNVVTSSGTTTYAYYVFSEDEMTMINNEGMPYRLYKRPKATVTELPKMPSVTSPKTIESLIAKVEPERLVSAEQLAHPDTSVRDSRIVPADGYTWFFDGRCCGGNHKYRFHLSANGDAEFVVMDYDDSHKENILSKGRWFTVGNIALHIVYEGKYYNYLYTTGKRTMSYSEYMPEGPIFSHISFQSYERGDFRIFNKTLYDDNIKRPRGFNGEKPVYEPGDYQTGSD